MESGWRKITKRVPWVQCLVLALAIGLVPGMVMAQAPPLDPLTIPKYVTPLVIPPVMDNTGVDDTYDISVREFKQQILPGGIWNTINGRLDTFNPTTVWSYGPTSDETPIVAPDPNSQFNYPAYTFETKSNVRVDVRWINDLIDPLTGNALPHVLGSVVDQTLHWANPRMDKCRDGSYRTDCTTDNPVSYDGAVPIVTHVHGAHVEPESDGYPEAWWLPAAADVDCAGATTTTDDDYACSGTVYTGGTGNDGYADYSYVQTQPATTLWYHDHSLGMTRLNVYAGPAGFWLVRGRDGFPSDHDSPVNVLNGLPAALPGPAPVAGQGVLALNIPGNPVRNSIREIPIVIQDRSFYPDGSL